MNRFFEIHVKIQTKPAHLKTKLDSMWSYFKDFFLLWKKVAINNVLKRMGIDVINTSVCTGLLQMAQPSSHYFCQ